MRNFPLNFRTFCRNPEKPSIRSEPSIVSKFQKRDGNFAELAERAMREREKPEFVYKILRIRHVRSPRERLASSSAAAARFCAASKPIVFYLAASMAALIGSDVRRSGKRLMCFAHFRDILSVTAELHPPPPLRHSSRRSPQHFSIVASAFLALAAPVRIALFRTVTTFSAVLLHGIPRRGYSVPSRVIFPHADVVRTFGQSTYIAPFVRRGRAKVQHPRARRARQLTR